MIRAVLLIAAVPAGLVATAVIGVRAQVVHTCVVDRANAHCSRGGAPLRVHVDSDGATVFEF